MNLSTLSNIKRKRSNAPGNGLLTQLKLPRSRLNVVESLQVVNEKTQFKTEEEVIADVINNYSNCCSISNNCLISLFKNSDGSVDWKMLTAFYQKCMNEYKGMNDIEKQKFEAKNVRESIVCKRGERYSFMWKLASERQVCIQTFRLVCFIIDI